MLIVIVLKVIEVEIFLARKAIAVLLLMTLLHSLVDFPFEIGGAATCKAIVYITAAIALRH